MRNLLSMLFGFGAVAACAWIASLDQRSAIFWSVCAAICVAYATGFFVGAAAEAEKARRMREGDPEGDPT